MCIIASVYDGILKCFHFGCGIIFLCHTHSLTCIYFIYFFQKCRLIEVVDIVH